MIWNEDNNRHMVSWKNSVLFLIELKEAEVDVQQEAGFLTGNCPWSIWLSSQAVGGYLDPDEDKRLISLSVSRTWKQTLADFFH